MPVTRIYTAEIYFPPWPNTAIKHRVLCGSLESNRDSLSSSMILVVELHCSNAFTARKEGKQIFKLYCEDLRKRKDKAYGSE